MPTYLSWRVAWECAPQPRVTWLVLQASSQHRDGIKCTGPRKASRRGGPALFSGNSLFTTRSRRLLQIWAFSFEWHFWGKGAWELIFFLIICNIKWRTIKRRSLEPSNSQGQRVEGWLPGAWRGRERGVVSWGQFRLGRWESSRDGQCWWLHNSVNGLHGTELCTEKWLKRETLCYVYFTTIKIMMKSNNVVCVRACEMGLSGTVVTAEIVQQFTGCSSNITVT